MALKWRINRKENVPGVSYRGETAKQDTRLREVCEEQENRNAAG